MTLLATIAAWSLLAFGLLLFLFQLAAHELGYQFGRRRAARRAAPADSVGVVVGGMLGLLAFVLALTLSFANSSFSERRAGTLAEANAIGTAWLRAQAIGGPRGSEIARLLEQYTHLRIDFIQADQGAAETRRPEPAHQRVADARSGATHPPSSASARTRSRPR